MSDLPILNKGNGRTSELNRRGKTLAVNGVTFN